MTMVGIVAIFAGFVALSVLTLPIISFTETTAGNLSASSNSYASFAALIVRLFPLFLWLAYIAGIFVYTQPYRG